MRTRTFLLVVSAFAGCALLLLTSAPLRAQSPAQGPIHLDLSVTLDHVSLHEGDATVGAYSKRGFTGSVAVRTAIPFGAELFLAYLPADDDPYGRAPRILMSGGWVTMNFRKDPDAQLGVFVAAGGSYVRVAEWPDFSGCTWEVGCMREGGADFSNGSGFAWVWGGGLTYRPWRIVSFRVDVRTHSTNDLLHQRSPRFGVGAGVRVR